MGQTLSSGDCAGQVAGLCQRKYGLLVGSGTAALTVACQTLHQERNKVVLPAITCISVLYSVLYAGCIPVFADVCPATGLIDPESVGALIEKDPSIGAIIVVHVYGFVADCPNILELAKRKSILVIEDAAQAQGGHFEDGRPLGGVGDISLVSFGHTKILDLGGGGVLMMDCPRIYADCLALVEDLPARPPNLDRLFSEFRSSYYLNWDMRHNDYSALSKIGDLHSTYRDMFLHRSNEEMVKRIICSLPDLCSEVSERRIMASQYAAGLAGLPDVHLCESSAGFVPWRFVVLVAGSERDSLLEFLRNQGIDASSWYPVLAHFYKDKGCGFELPNAINFESQVVNLWLTPGYSKHRIDDTCALIRDYFGERYR